MPEPVALPARLLLDCRRAFEFAWPADEAEAMSDKLEATLLNREEPADIERIAEALQKSFPDQAAGAVRTLRLTAAMEELQEFCFVTLRQLASQRSWERGTNLVLGYLFAYGFARAGAQERAEQLCEESRYLFEALGPGEYEPLFDAIATSLHARVSAAWKAPSVGPLGQAAEVQVATLDPADLNTYYAVCSASAIMEPKQRPGWKEPASARLPREEEGYVHAAMTMADLRRNEPISERLSVMLQLAAVLPTAVTRSQPMSEHVHRYVIMLVDHLVFGMLGEVRPRRLSSA